MESCGHAEVYSQFLQALRDSAIWHAVMKGRAGYITDGPSPSARPTSRPGTNSHQSSPARKARNSGRAVRSWTKNACPPA
jgi:hypothetical protein